MKEIYVPVHSQYKDKRKQKKHKKIQKNINFQFLQQIIVFLHAVEFYKNFIPLRDKIEAGADLVRTITSYNMLVVGAQLPILILIPTILHYKDFLKGAGKVI